MFSTFMSAGGGSRLPSTGPQNPGTSSVFPASGNGILRPKRSQVARACDLCRLNRTKCDEDQPCRNCRNKGVECSNSRSSAKEVRTLASANQEIDKLRSRVAQLEKDLETSEKRVRSSRKKAQDSGAPESEASARTEGGEGNGDNDDDNDDDDGSDSGDDDDDDNDEDDDNGDDDDSDESDGEETKSSRNKSVGSNRVDKALTNKTKNQWAGVWLSDIQNGTFAFFGPSSTNYYVHRLAACIRQGMRRDVPNYVLQPFAVSATHDASTFGNPAGDDTSSFDMNSGLYLSLGAPSEIPRAQEAEYLSFFWNSYPSVALILDEPEFRRHYESLWADPSTSSRKPSALVDIVIAISMQYNAAMNAANSASPTDGQDPSQAGQSFFQHSQTLLSVEQECPTLATVQSHILAAVYLNNALLFEAALRNVAMALSAAHAVGLHREPPVETALHQRDLQKRLWWMLSALDTKLSLVMGRPSLICEGNVDGFLTSNDDTPVSKIGLSTFQAYRFSLSHAVQSVSLKFFRECASVINNNDKSPYGNPDVLEACAAVLNQALEPLSSWTSALPSNLRVPRKAGTDEPMSTRNLGLALDSDAAPRSSQARFQRQCVLLEIQYHHFAAILHRPFLSFPATNRAQTQALALTCVDHAVTLVAMIHQVTGQAPHLLHGEFEVLHFVWDAILCMVGFVLANSSSPRVGPTRKAIHAAVMIFEEFAEDVGETYSAARGMARSSAELESLVEELTKQSTGGTATSSSSGPPLIRSGSITSSERMRSPARQHRRTLQHSRSRRNSPHIQQRQPPPQQQLPTQGFLVTSASPSLTLLPRSHAQDLSQTMQHHHLPPQEADFANMAVFPAPHQSGMSVLPEQPLMSVPLLRGSDHDAVAAAAAANMLVSSEHWPSALTSQVTGAGPGMESGAGGDGDVSRLNFGLDALDGGLSGSGFFEHHHSGGGGVSVVGDMDVHAAADLMQMQVGLDVDAWPDEAMQPHDQEQQ